MMFFNRKVDYKHYLTGFSLPVWNYNKVNETKDYRYALKIDDYDYLPIITDDKLKEIELSFGQITEEYINRIGKRQSEQNIFETNRSIEEIETRYELIKQLCFIIFIGGYDKETVDTIKKYGYSIREKTAKEDAEQARKQAKRLVTDANVKRKILSELTEQNNNNTTFNDILYAINTKTGLHIDPRKTSLFDWLDIEDNFFKQLTNELSKQRSNS